ncbi:hypothetical protein [Vogesella mureinivorans]|jgi:hypothetical protein|uniref:hypothetical protein n=1 Tax=Vogesella mureinivorans TaxID=657276 RepID=UPI0011CC4152|nr:hypothetical protein [Vogesella mureinivorans]
MFQHSNRFLLVSFLLVIGNILAGCGGGGSGGATNPASNGTQIPVTVFTVRDIFINGPSDAVPFPSTITQPSALWEYHTVTLNGVNGGYGSGIIMGKCESRYRCVVDNGGARGATITLDDSSNIYLQNGKSPGDSTYIYVAANTLPAGPVMLTFTLGSITIQKTVQFAASP